MLAKVITAGLPVVVMGTMFTQGLRLRLGGGLATFKDRPLLMLRSLIVVLVLVPIVALAVVLLFKPSPATAAGIAILAATPAATFQLRNIYRKGGNAAYLQALHLSLALLAMITVPAVLELLSAALGFEADVGVLHVGKTVVQAVLLPVIVGMTVRAALPEVAGRIEPPLSRLFEIGLVLLVVPLLIKTYSLLLRIDAVSYVAMITFIAVNIGLGHVLGPRDAQERTTLAIESGERNTGLAMTIGALNFSPERTLPVMIPYIVLYMVISTLYLKWRERETAAGLRPLHAS